MLEGRKDSTTNVKGLISLQNEIKNLNDKITILEQKNMALESKISTIEKDIDEILNG